MWSLRRRPRGGRHASLRGAVSPVAVPVFLPLYAAVPGAATAPVPGPPAAPTPTPPPAPAPMAPNSGVALVFNDGSAMVLDPDDPRVRAFLAVAGQIIVR